MNEETATDRPWGTGSVTLHRGRFRGRLPHTHGRASVGVFDTRAEAEAAITAALAELEAAPLTVPTLAAWGERWIPTRDVRANTRDRDLSRFRLYFGAKTRMGALPLTAVTAETCAAWLASTRTKAAQTRQNALGLLRQAFAAAATRTGPCPGLPNPCVELKLGKRAKAKKADGWDWLRAHEVEAVVTCTDIPMRARLLFIFAIFTGLRAGELCGLRWEDVDEARGVVHVRWSRGEPTKGGKPREVPLLAPAVAAIRAWGVLARAARTRSHLALVWPARDGGYHADGYDAGWDKLRKVAGVTRRVRFHDLRHTFASHMLQGTWAPTLIARPLRLEELRDLLGHADIGITQRYAHLCSDAVSSLVHRDTSGTQTLSRPRDLNSGPTVYEGPGAARIAREIEHESDAVSRAVSRVERAMMRTAESAAAGDKWIAHRALDLVEANEALLDALVPGRAEARTA